MQPDDVALGQRERQVHRGVLVEHVGAVAGRAGEHRRAGGAAVAPVVIRYRIASSSVSTSPVKTPASRYTQRVPPRWITAITEVTSVPASPTSPRPGSTIVCGTSSPNDACSAALIAAPYAASSGWSPWWSAGKPPPRSSSHGRIPSRRSARNTRADASIGAAQAAGSRCCEPTWKAVPATSRPRAAAVRRISIASPVEQPYLRDSGQSEPDPDVTSRHGADDPGAASATLRTSSGESTTNSRTPRAYASATSARRLTGFE